MSLLRTSLFGWVLICCSFHSYSQEVSTLNIQTIMQGHNFVGQWPENIRWAPDSKTIYFDWNPEQEPVKSLFKTELSGLSPQKVSLAEQMKLLPSSGLDYSMDREQILFEKHGDIFILNTEKQEVRQITNTVNRESRPIFTAQDQHIVFRADNNLFRMALKDGSLVQLTHFSKEKPTRAENPDTDQETWLENDQLDFFDVLTERKEKRTIQDSLSNALKPKERTPINISGKSLATLAVSPNEKYVIFQLGKGAYGNRTEVADFVTESGYARTLTARQKVGGPQTTYDLGIYDILNDTSYMLDTRSIPGIFDKPEYLQEYTDSDSSYSPIYTKPREVIFLSPKFNQSGEKVVIVARALDNKDRWILQVNMEEGTFDLLDRQRDEAWVGGPGISEWNYSSGTLGWLADDRTIYFQSEESGYSHIYTLDTETRQRKALTSGNWEVYSVETSNDKRFFYLTANREGPAERHFYRMSTSGGALTRYTDAPGNYEVKISPDEKRLAIRYSYANKPWELYLMANKPQAEMRPLTHSTTPAFEKYSWREPAIVTFKAEDGSTVHARLYKPEKGGEKGPAVIFVHGAGYLQNAHLWWSQYFREYMFHNFLADHGYTVLDIDYRGSEGYGRDWRTGIYRHMGGKDLSDQVDGVKYLVQNHQVDPDRVGIYGGSYGGFITIFAMFKYPEIFKCGAALRSVTDWAHYNHGYTSNILNTPVEDSIAFRRSSPIYYADGLKGELLMLHGMIDTNVQFQDVVRLSQKLIELGKENWNVAIFPLEDHGFVEPSSWTDEYRRIFDLFESNLK